MNHEEYINFHNKFTNENYFEFSFGIYLSRDYVRKKEININNLNEFITLLKKTPEAINVLNYLLNKNITSKTTTKAIEFLKNNINN